MPQTTRRTAITALGAGVAGLASLSLLPSTALASMSGANGIVAGGSLEGPDGPIQFSAFGTRIEFDDADPAILGALEWHDPTGLEGEPLTIAFVAANTYGPDPDEPDTARILSGTASVNGDGEHPFALRLVDGGEIGVEPDSIRLVVGAGAEDVTGTPVADDAEAGFDYDVDGELTSGNIQIVALA